MPPVGALIAPLVTAVTAGVSAITATTLGALAFKAFTQIALGAGLSALGQALQKRPAQRLATGIRVSETVGEDVPATIILGRFATRGHRVYIGSQGKTGDAPNSFLTEVLEIADFPAALRRVMVNGEWVRLSGISDPLYGPQVVEYKSTKKDNYYLWIRYHDGTQTTADAGLLAMFPGGPRPWIAEMIGRGIPYAIVTARTNPEIHRGKPECVFEVDGAALYDPRLDTTAGGSGPHRFDDQGTWARTDNPVVMIYNILLGLRDPVTDEVLFGGGVGQFQLPLATWAAAMNACDADAAGESGAEPAYRAGIEIPLADDYTAADAIGELLTSCQGRIAEVAGQWLIAVGPPPAAVYAFTDDDVIVSEPDEFDPFPGLDETYNGIVSTYPEPEDGWQPRAGPERRSAAYLAADGGQENIASVQYPCVWARAQVQRLDKAALADHRRMRRHTLMLPPDCRVGPLDAVEWTSDRNGYADKRFFVDLVEEDQASGCVALALREVDPNDYDFGEGDLLPTSVGYTGRLPVLPLPTPFSVEPAYVIAADGSQKRPAIRMNWDPDVSEVNGVRYVIRVAAQPDHEPLAGGADFSDDDLSLSVLEEYPGQPLYQYPGETIAESVQADVARGTMIVSAGILPATAYQVRMRYRRPGKDGPWSAWLDVTTFDLRIEEDDLAAVITDKINTAKASAEAASILADEAMTLAIAAADATGTVGRLMAGGWVKDPGFANWTGDATDDWVEGNYPAEITFNATGFFDNHAAEVNSASSVTGAYLRAGYLAGQMNTLASLETDYVVVSLMLEYVSGSLAAGRARARWNIGGTYVTGAFPMHATANGDLDKLGFRPTVTVRQLIQFIQTKPAGTASEVRLEFYAGINAALRVIVHSFDMRAANASEIDAIALRLEVEAEVETLQLEIEGVETALAADITALTATVGGNTAAITDQAVALATATGALSQRLITVEAGRDGANLVRNGAFLDGERGPGVAPDFWRDWPAGWRVARRGDTALGSTLAWCPSQFAVRMPLDAGALWQANVVGGGASGTQFPCAEGDVLSVRFRYSVAGGSRDATIRVFLRFYDAAGTLLTTAAEGLVNTGDASNPWPTFWDPEVFPPANTAYCTIGFRRGAGGAGVAFFTDLEVRRVDPTIVGRLQAVIGLKADAGDPASLDLISINEGDVVTSIIRLKAKHILLGGETYIESGFISKLIVDLATVNVAYIKEANIVDAAIKNAKIDDLAVTRLKVGGREITTNSTAVTDGTVTLSTSALSVQSLSVVSPADTTRRVHFSVRQSWFGGIGGYTLELQSSLNGGAWATKETLADLAYNDPRDGNAIPVVYTHADSNATAGTYVYRLVATAQDYGSGYTTSPAIRKRMISVDMNMR